MKTEVEFRGLRKDGEGFAYGDRVQGASGKVYIFDYDDIVGNSYIHEVIPESVGQFTGLKDKNGVKVFEGDNVKITEDDEDSLSEEFEFEGVVIYGENGKSVGKNFITNYPCSFTIYCKDFYHEEGLLGNRRHQIEIIGNIHDICKQY